MKYILIICLLTVVIGCAHRSLDRVSKRARQTAVACCNSISLSRGNATASINACETVNTSPSALSLMEWNEDIFTW